MSGPGYCVPVSTPAAPHDDTTVTRAEFAHRLGLSRSNSLSRVRGCPQPDAPSRLVDGKWLTCWREETVARFVAEHTARGAGHGWRRHRTS
jgi:hypothetical protein